MLFEISTTLLFLGLCFHFIPYALLHARYESGSSATAQPNRMSSWNGFDEPRFCTARKLFHLSLRHPLSFDPPLVLPPGPNLPLRLRYLLLLSRKRLRVSKIIPSNAQLDAVLIKGRFGHTSLMANKYEKRYHIIEFKEGDFCTIKVPKKDQPASTATVRVLCKVLNWRGNIYELQTKFGILRSRLCSTNPYISESPPLRTSRRT